MRVLFSTLASLELEDAVLYYESDYTGRGKRFKNEVKQATIRISKFPKLGPVVQNEIRQCILHKFPYKILYSIENNYIFVIAVAHQHRKPDYWVNRIK